MKKVVVVQSAIIAFWSFGDCTGKWNKLVIHIK